MTRTMTPAVPTSDAIAGRYRIEGLLGHGGMADVYRAIDEQDSRPVAVKVVRSTDPELARRLTLEAKAVAGFDHPGLVRLLDAGVHEDHAYLVMELVDGPSLAERLRKGPLAPDRSASLGTTLAEALAYVHERGVVHRDVKPANVLLGPGSRARLADFGIAQVLDASSATVTGTTLGTAGYMAPEQLAHHRVGTEADIWSLGAVLVEGLTARRGFEGSPAEVVAQRLAGATPSTEGLPAPWRMLLSSMLEADPAHRPQASDVAEMLRAPGFARSWVPTTVEETAVIGTEADGNEALTAAMGPPTAIGAPPLPGPRPVRSESSRRAMVVGAVLGAVLLVALAAWGLSGGSPTAHTNRSTTTTTTTTGPPTTPAQAEAVLVRDVQQGESSGTLATSVGKNILTELGQTLSAASQGKTDQVQTGLGAIDQTITMGAANGQVSVAETTTLLADVANLATTLSAQNPTATTTTTRPGAPKHAH